MGVVGIVVVLAIGGGIWLYRYHLGLLSRGEGERIIVGGQTVLRLGIEAGNALPSTLEVAYDKGGMVNGEQIRIPKYGSNALFRSELGGIISAENLDTGQEEVYRWTPNTIYRCGTRAMMTPPPELRHQVDVKRDLKNYLFVVTGDGWWEPKRADELAQFRTDATPFDPIKLYTTAATPDASGQKKLVAVVLFTSHESCTGNPVAGGAP